MKGEAIRVGDEEDVERKNINFHHNNPVISFGAIDMIYN